ncbi:hydroxymethylbilane synthase [Candidatus Marinamargulisbacteria bacterium SCGC AG-414-C22]|nr:hydroxymethylbilane synthase [Candidatus Marinamargulisbacteria bacterium SCGC AG-414-C22]
MAKTIKIGTRPSKLALVQANLVKNHLQQAFPDLSITLVEIRSEGDINQTDSLTTLGGKGVFIKTLEQELLQQRIDIAVHSFKDITASIDETTHLSCFLKPEATSDCVVMSATETAQSLAELPAGSVVATSSLRRKLLLQQYYPSLKTKDIRGNVDTRIKKCDEGFAAATLLSEAGLMRLNLTQRITESLPKTTFVPAPGQGVVAVQSRKTDTATNQMLQTITDPHQTIISQLEFLFLQTVGLDCNYPLGLHIEIINNRVNLLCKWAVLNTTSLQIVEQEFALNQAETTIVTIANAIKKNINN